MKIEKFIGNEEDNLHCFQACYRMALHCLLGREVSLREAEYETGFISGKQTWPHAGILNFIQQGLSVRLIEKFDYKRFSEEPYDYLRINTNNDEIFESILKESDLDFEKELVSKFLSSDLCVVENRLPTGNDIKSYDNESSIIIANVNYWRLLKKEGYDGHFVIIEKYGEDNVILQNPGLPPVQNQVVPTEDFISAWKNDEGADFSNLIIVSKT